MFKKNYVIMFFILLYTYSCIIGAAAQSALMRYGLTKAQYEYALSKEPLEKPLCKVLCQSIVRNLQNNVLATAEPTVQDLEVLYRAMMSPYRTNEQYHSMNKRFRQDLSKIHPDKLQKTRLLVYAASWADELVVTELVKMKVPLELTDNQGHTALSKAWDNLNHLTPKEEWKRESYQGMIMSLLEAGASLCVKGNCSIKPSFKPRFTSDSVCRVTSDSVCEDILKHWQKNKKHDVACYCRSLPTFVTTPFKALGRLLVTCVLRSVYPGVMWRSIKTP